MKIESLRERLVRTAQAEPWDFGWPNFKSEASQSPVKASRISDLSAADRERWRAWICVRDDSIPSPFLMPEYAESLCKIAPGGEIVRLTRCGSTVAYWAFQRRGDVIQPLAAPLTDYQQVVTAPGVDLDLGSLVRAVGAGRYCFTGLASPPADGLARSAMIADVRSGFAAYHARQMRLHSKYFKDKLRQSRNLEAVGGALSFKWHDPDPATLDWLLSRKRAQFSETAQYDVFTCGWTAEILRRLVEARTAEFGGSVFAMRSNGWLIAAIYTLRMGPVCHVWFPTFDRELGRFSPGAVSMLNLMRLAAEEGVHCVDFGLEGEKYKQYFAEPRGSFYEGAVRAGAPPFIVAHGSDASRRSTSNLQRLLLKARRRRFLLAACEPRRRDRLKGLVTMTAGLIARKVLGRFAKQSAREV